MRKRNTKVSFVAMLLLVAVAFLSSACSFFGDGPEDVAKDFVQAICVDLDGDDAVDLMSSELIKQSMKQFRCETKSELASYMEERGVIKDVEDILYGRYGDDLEVNVLDAEVKNLYKEDAVVKVTFSTKNSDSNPSFNIVTVCLVKEDGDWRVSNYNL